MRKLLAVLASLFLVVSFATPAQSAGAKYSVYQKTLATFSSTATTLSSQQKAQVKAAVDANPTAEKFICTGIRYYSQPMSVNIMVRKRAKAACEYAKQLNPELSTWYQNKPTQARSYAGKVLLTIKTPIAREVQEPPMGEELPSNFQDPWSAVEIFETDSVPGVFTVGDGLGWRILESQNSAELYRNFSPQYRETSWYECPSQLPTEGSTSLGDCSSLGSSDWLPLQEKHIGKSFAMKIDIDWVRQGTQEFVLSKTYISRRSPLVTGLPAISIVSQPKIIGTWEVGSTATILTGQYSGGSGADIQVSIQTYQCLEELPEQQVFTSANFDSAASRCFLPSHSGLLRSRESWSTKMSDSLPPGGQRGFFTAVVNAGDGRQVIQTVLQTHTRTWEHPLKKAARCVPQGWNGSGDTSLSADSSVLTLQWKIEGVQEAYKSQLTDCLAFALDMPLGVRTAIDATSAIQGVKTATWGRLFASWAFSPDTGLIMRVEFSRP